MSNLNSNPRSETQPGILSRLDKGELKSIKVAITRRNVSEPNSSAPLLRSLDDPSQLIVHYRPDEGSRPIFDREDIVVNKENAQEERTILSSVQASSQQATSRSSSRSSRSSVDRAPIKEKRSPQPHSYPEDERPRNKDYYSSKYRRSSSHSRKSVYKTRKTPSPPSRSSHKPPVSHRHSRSPPRYRSSSKDKLRGKREGEYRSSDKDKSLQKYRGVKQRSQSPTGYRGLDRRRSSRSPPSRRDKYESRSPHKNRGHPERRRSRTPPPPPRRSSRGRSRNRSPYPRSSRSRYSRSPHRHGYERSKHSGSPRHHRYSPERHSRRSPPDDRSYQNPRIPTHPYFQGPEFWIPDPTMQPRFIPRQMIPPFPYGPPFRPGMPMMVPPQFQFRPRNVYNRPPRPRMITASESRTTTVTTTAPTESTVARVEDSANISESTPQIKESEHSLAKNNDNENKD